MKLKSEHDLEQRLGVFPFLHSGDDDENDDWKGKDLASTEQEKKEREIQANRKRNNHSLERRIDFSGCQFKFSGSADLKFNMV